MKVVNSNNPNSKVDRSSWVALAILSVVATFVMYVETMVIPAIPDMIKDFAIPYNTSSWILASYLVTAAVTAPILGKLSDVYGRKKLLLISVVIYSVGITLGGVAHNLSIMLLARSMQGIGFAVIPISFSIIRNKFPEDKLSLAMGIFTPMYAAGTVLGVAAGGNIVERLGWHATFLTVLPVTIIFLVLVTKFITEQKIVPKKLSDDNRIKITKIIDIKGAITLAATISTFLLVLTYLQNSGLANSSYLVVTLAATAIVSLVLFVITERRTTNPLVDIRLIMHKTLLPTNLTILLNALGMFLIFQTIPVLVRSPFPLGFGGNAVSATNVILPLMVAFLIFASFTSYLLPRIGNLKMVMIGGIMNVFGFAGLYLFHNAESMISVNLAIIGAGIALLNNGAFNASMISTPKQVSGISLSISAMLYIIGSSIGPSISGMFMQGNQAAIKGISGLFPNAESYNLIFLTGFMVSVVTLALSIMIRKGLKVQTVKDELDDSNTINLAFQLQSTRLKLIQEIRHFIIQIYIQMIRFVKKTSSLRKNKNHIKNTITCECRKNS
ncbi:MAG: MFS transporter [Nitrosotalea sp.]